MARLWYAVQHGSDFDCGTGSTRKSEARKMATALHREFPGEEVRIVVTEGYSDFALSETVVYAGEK